MQYVIIALTPYGREKIDSFDTIGEARAMLAEYHLAFRGCGYSLSIKRQRVAA